MSKILVVEDDYNIRSNIAEILEINGYTPVAASDGAEALSILSNNLPDLIISDVLMPNVSGLELKQQLQTSNTLKEIPFIFLSAKADLRDIREGMNLGADDYLTKPFKLNDLLSTVKLRLEKRKADTTLNPVSFQDNQIAELKQKLAAFSASEKKVLALLAQNMSSVEIGKKLFLSTKTVQNHRANMARKIKLSGSNSLLDFSIRCRLAGLL